MYDFNIELLMTKTIMALSLATTIIMGTIALSILPAYAPSPKGLDVCELIDEDNCRLVFSWLPADTSSDPANLIIITGSFSRLGLLSDSTTDVQGSLEGMMIGAAKSISSKSVTTTAGTATISTTVDAKSRGVNNLMGTVLIDGVAYTTTLKAAGLDATLIQVSETFTSPTFSQSVIISQVTIPTMVKMCNDDESKCFHGFGTIRRGSSQSTTPSGESVTFSTDELEAEVLNEDGLFSLRLLFIQRTVEPNIKPFEGMVGTTFTINDPFGRLVPSAVVVFTLSGDDVCTQGTTVGDLTVSGDGITASGTVPASLSAVVHGVTVHDTDQCNASILPSTLQFVVI